MNYLDLQEWLARVELAYQDVDMREVRVEASYMEIKVKWKNEVYTLDLTPPAKVAMEKKEVGKK